MCDVDQTLLTVTPTSVGVWDVNAGVLAGQSSLDLRTILNPEVAVPRSTSEGTSVLAAQNLGTYKGKVFALVSCRALTGDVGLS